MNTKMINDYFLVKKGSSKESMVEVFSDANEKRGRIIKIPEDKDKSLLNKLIYYCDTKEFAVQAMKIRGESYYVMKLENIICLLEE